MFTRLARPALLLAATAALGACSTYGGFGGTSVSVGYGNGGYYPYRYSPYSYYGWYDGYYYPGAGYYIYDSYGRRHRWSDRHRHYWEGRRDGRRNGGENWDGYRRDRDGRYHDGGRDGNRGDRGNWQRRGNGGGETAGARQSAPPVARPQPQRSETPRATRPEARGGRPSVDRGREFRRGSQD